MTGGQEALIPRASIQIWRRFIEDSNINHAQWLRAVAEGAFCGDCSCGDYLAPRSPEQVGNRTDYTAVCRSTECGKEICAPNGRLKTRSKTGA